MPGPGHDYVSFMESELIRRIEGGDAVAVRDLERILYPGVRFLLQRRLGKRDVDRESRAVLGLAIHGIRAGVSLEVKQVLGMVRQLIEQQTAVDATPELASVEAGGTPEVRKAKGILDQMSAVQRDALRRCYALGQAPESFLKGLNLSVEEFRAVQSRARAEFRRNTRTENVA